MQQTSKDIAVKKLSNIMQTPGIEEYLEEAEFLKKARADAESVKIPIIDDETGRFLELACILLKPLKILEIGCGTGYSTYFLLKSIIQELTAGKSVKGMDKSIESFGQMDAADESAGGACRAKEPYGSEDKSKKSACVRDRTIESAGSSTIRPNGDKTRELSEGICKTVESSADIYNTGNSKKQFSYTGVDLNRERLDQACSFISGMINKTIIPCHDGKRMKTFIECEGFCCSFEFIHGNAVKVIKEEQETEEKYDMVFIDAAKYQYPDYLEAVRDKLGTGCAVIADNIFYNGKIFKEETLKHDSNSVAGLTEYLRIINREDAFETSLFNIGDGIALSIYNKGK